MKKKTIVFLLLTICTVMIPAQVDTFEVKTDIRWERDLLRIRVENALNPEIFVIQEAKLQAEREIEKAFPRILRMALEPIVVNSKETVKDLISTDLTYLNVIESLSQNAFQENFYLSENLDVLIATIGGLLILTNFNKVVNTLITAGGSLGSQFTKLGGAIETIIALSSGQGGYRKEVYNEAVSNFQSAYVRGQQKNYANTLTQFIPTMGAETVGKFTSLQNNLINSTQAQIDDFFEALENGFTFQDPKVIKDMIAATEDQTKVAKLNVQLTRQQNIASQLLNVAQEGQGKQTLQAIVNGEALEGTTHNLSAAQQELTNTNKKANQQMLNQIKANANNFQQKGGKSGAGLQTGIGFLSLGAGIGGLIGSLGNMFSQAMDVGWSNINWGQAAFNGLAGMATGAIMASPLGFVASGVAIAGIGFVQSVGNDLFDSNGDWSQINWGSAVISGFFSGLFSGLGKWGYNILNARVMKWFSPFNRSSFATMKILGSIADQLAKLPKYIAALARSLSKSKIDETFIW